MKPTAGPKHNSLVARRRAIFENGSQGSISHEEIHGGKLQIFTNAERKKMKEERAREFLNLNKTKK